MKKASKKRSASLPFFETLAKHPRQEDVEMLTSCPVETVRGVVIDKDLDEAVGSGITPNLVREVPLDPWSPPDSLHLQDLDL